MVAFKQGESLKTMEDATFLRYLLLKNYSENSTKDILSTLRFFEKKYKFELDEVTAFTLECRKKGIRTTTLNKYLANLKVYGRFKAVSWINDIPTIRGNETVNKVLLSPDEVKRFLELPKYQGAKDWDKWYLFWKILAYTGCRPNEVANLKDTDIDWGAGLIYVRKTKTKEARIAPIHPDLVADLEKIGEGYICNFTKTAWVQHFNRRLKRAEIKKRQGLTAYSFRHTVATSLLDADKNVYLVKNLLGHKKTSTTEQYYKFSINKLHSLISALPYTTTESMDDSKITLIKELASKIKSKKMEQKETNAFFQIKIYK